MLFEFSLSTNEADFYNVTGKTEEAVRKSGVKSGIAVVFCPHTTAGITINENADSDVARDLMFAFRETFPNRHEFRHAEGNSAAHLKSSIIGASETVIIEDGKLLLGEWQDVYFVEFDPPRQRKLYVKVIGDK